MFELFLSALEDQLGLIVDPPLAPIARMGIISQEITRVTSRGLTKRAADECLCSSDKKHDFRNYTMAHVELCEWCGTRR